MENKNINFNVLYNELDDLLGSYINRYNLNPDNIEYIPISKKRNVIIKGNIPISHLIRNYSKELDKICTIRNKVIHKYTKDISVSDALINKVERLITIIKEPQTSLEFFKADVFKCRQSDILSDIISKMNECKYTHVPVYSDDNVFQGILNESNISNYFCTSLISKSNLLKDNMKVGEIDLTHTSELCEFIPGITLVYEIENKFYNSISENQRLGVLFITQNGHKNEEIKGIITPWDLPRLKDLKFVEE